VFDTWACLSGVVEVLKLPLLLLLLLPVKLPRLLLRLLPWRRFPRAALIAAADAFAGASPGAVHLDTLSLRERRLDGSAHACTTACEGEGEVGGRQSGFRARDFARWKRRRQESQVSTTRMGGTRVSFVAPRVKKKVEDS
jgi:hypothetical protein